MARHLSWDLKTGFHVEQSKALPMVSLLQLKDTVGLYAKVRKFWFSFLVLESTSYSSTHILCTDGNGVPSALVILI